jgi:hypothetical protein
MLSRRLSVALALGFCAVPGVSQADDSARGVAVRYLDALTGGDPSGKELTFGGKTMAVELEQLENYTIKAVKVKKESAPLVKLSAAIAKLDRAGETGMSRAHARAGAGGGDMGTITELSPEDAQAIAHATERESRVVLKNYPVFGKISRVGKGVYWSPKNPARKLLKDAGTFGTYSLELHTFDVECLEGPRQTPRVWHLKVFRFRGGAVDTGFRILAAADWALE